MKIKSLQIIILSLNQFKRVWNLLKILIFYNLYTEILPGHQISALRINTIYVL